MEWNQDINLSTHGEEWILVYVLSNPGNLVHS